MTPNHEAAASAVQTEAAGVTVYFRHAFIPETGYPDPFRVQPHTGRWGTDWTLHTAEGIHVTLSEYCRQAADDVERADPTGGVGINAANLSSLGTLEVPDPLLGRALFRLTFRFARLADLTTPNAGSALDTAGFDPANFYADDFEECQALAKAGEASGWDALRAPSAAWRPDGYCVAVFDRGRQQLVRQRIVADRVRPTIAVAYATTYKAGERPSWL